MWWCPRITHIAFYSLLLLCVNTGYLLIIASYIRIVCTEPDLELISQAFILTDVCLLTSISILHTKLMFYPNRQKTFVMCNLIFSTFVFLFTSVTIFYFSRSESVLIGYVILCVVFILETRDSIRDYVQTQTNTQTTERLLPQTVVPSVTLQVHPHSHSYFYEGETNTECDESFCDKCPCPVCLSDFTEYVELECNHRICVDCLKQLAKVSNRCPCCRQELPYAIHLQTRIEL